MPTLERVLSAARSLNATDRVRLAEVLWEEADISEWPDPADEWLEEAAKRSASYDAGSTSASPWSEVRLRARQKAGLGQ